MRTHRKRLVGFTLVELLVVIGIIALLISILLPSLGRARASANLVACQSNFKQVYSSLLFYANDNGGKLPWASASNNWGPTGTNVGTYAALTKYLNPSFVDETTSPLSPVFTCTEALPNAAGNAWSPNSVRTLRFNPRAFPGYDQQASDAGNPTKPPMWPQRKLSSIRNGSEKIAFWDGPQITWWNMSVEPENIFLDGWRWSWGHMYADPPVNSYDLGHMSQPINSGANRDDGWWVCGVRYRHILGTRTPVGFFDGHVESRKSGEILAKEICVNQ